MSQFSHLKQESLCSEREEVKTKAACDSGEEDASARKALLEDDSSDDVTDDEFGIGKFVTWCI